MDPALEELFREGDSNDEVEAIIRLHYSESVPPRVNVVSRFNDIATCRIRRGDINNIRSHEYVASLKASQLLEVEAGFDSIGLAKELMPIDVRRPKTLDITGKNTIVAIIDFGLDIRHENFRNNDGTTRLIALWDQSKTKKGDVPEQYGYGKVYSQDELNESLILSINNESVGYTPKNSSLTAHGTHVTDIAAGNGNAIGSPVGIAPESDLIFVQLATRGTSGLATLGDSVRILEAIDFIRKTAGETPFVINMSVGKCGSSKDGLSLVEMAMDNFLLEAPGRAIVQSCGNYFLSSMASSGQIHPGERHTLTWETDRRDTTTNELEIWTKKEDVITIEIKPPNVKTVFRVYPGEIVPIEIEDKEIGRVYYRLSDPNNNDNVINLFLMPNAPTGQYEIRLNGEDIVDGRYHAWVERDSSCQGCQSKFIPSNVKRTYTIGSIASGYRPIAVGAYNAHSSLREIAPFSSSGPTRDGRLKPDLIAPGVDVLAAKASSSNSLFNNSLVTRKSGTSMASPNVCGAVSLIFEAAGRPLWINETRKLLLENTDPVTELAEMPERLGNGYLNIEKAVVAAREYTKNNFLSDTATKSEMDDLNIENLAINNVIDILESSGEESTMKESTESHKKKNFILLSGGPGPYDDRDVEHDKSWANYVTPPLLLSLKDEKIVSIGTKDEDVLWFVYKPAYSERWETDLKDNNRKKAIEDVKNEGFTSYIDKITGRAKDRGWILIWLDDADEFWTKIKLLNDPISRLWYWGHARHDLWLGLRHNSAGDAVAPDTSAIITVDSIKKHKSLKSNFNDQDKIRQHRFIGCNTEAFAEKWASTFGTWTEGIKGKVDFGGIHKSGGEPSLVKKAKRKLFSPTGQERIMAEDTLDTIQSEKVLNNNYIDILDRLVLDGTPAQLLKSATDTVLESYAQNQNNPYIVEEIFNAFTNTESPYRDNGVSNLFEKIAGPGEKVPYLLQSGDMVVRKAIGEPIFSNVSVITNGDIIASEYLSHEGLAPEKNSEGYYVEVIEAWPTARYKEDRFARRIANKGGIVDYSNLIIRLKDTNRLSKPSENDTNSIEVDPISAAGLGLAAFQAAAGFLTRGKFSYRSDIGQYIHAGTPDDVIRYKYTRLFMIKAKYPDIIIGDPEFWFELSYEYNGFDIFAAKIEYKRTRSDSLKSSSFNINFIPTPNSKKQDKISVIRFNISGWWDPVGFGDVSFHGNIYLTSNGKITSDFKSEVDSRWYTVDTKVFEPVFKKEKIERITKDRPVVPEVRHIYNRTVYFRPSNSYQLEDKTIRELHSWFMNIPSRDRIKVIEGVEPIQLVGFASTTGTVAQNQVLARKRVENVKGYLNDWTDNGAKFKPTAFGELTAKTDDNVEDPKERRVEVHFLGQIVRL